MHNALPASVVVNEAAKRAKRNIKTQQRGHHALYYSQSARIMRSIGHWVPMRATSHVMMTGVIDQRRTTIGFDGLGLLT